MLSTEVTLPALWDIYPVHPNISINILLTVLYTFPTTQEIFQFVMIFFILVILMCDPGVIL